MKEVASEMKAQGPQRHLDPDSGYPRESSHASRVRFWIILIQLSNKAFLLCFLSVGFSFLEFIWLLERRQNHERMVSLGWRRSACVETGPGIDRNPVLVCSPLLGDTLTPKTAWEGKGFLPLTVYSLPWRGARGGAQGGNRKSWKPSRKAASLLHTVFPAGSLGYAGQGACPGVAPPTVGGALPASDPSLKHLTHLPTGQPDGSTFSCEFPSSQMTLAYIKCTKNRQQQQKINQYTLQS